MPVEPKQPLPRNIIDSFREWLNRGNGDAAEAIHTRYLKEEGSVKIHC